MWNFAATHVLWRSVPYTVTIWYRYRSVGTVPYLLVYCTGSCVMYCTGTVPDVLVVVVDKLSHGVHRVDVFYKKDISRTKKNRRCKFSIQYIGTLML